MNEQQFHSEPLTSSNNCYFISPILSPSTLALVLPAKNVSFCGCRTPKPVQCTYQSYGTRDQKACHKYGENRHFLTMATWATNHYISRASLASKTLTNAGGRVWEGDACMRRVHALYNVQCLAETWQCALYWLRGCTCIPQIICINSLAVISPGGQVGLSCVNGIALSQSISYLYKSESVLMMGRFNLVLECITRSSFSYTEETTLTCVINTVW